MKTTDELVREIADREAIRDLPVLYCDCLSRKDLEGLVSLFTEGGTFAAKAHEHEVVTRGRSDLKLMFENVLNNGHPRHFIHTHVVKLHSVNSASGRCSVELRRAVIEADRQTEWIGSGYYEDNYAKVGDEWKFASRRLVEIGMAIPLRTFMV
jgi:SnoaL-like domain